MHSFNQEVGARIRERREALNMYQRDLAVLLQTTTATISRYEKGEINLTADLLKEITRSLGCRVSVLLGEEDVLASDSEEVRKAYRDLPFVYKRMVNAAIVAIYKQAQSDERRDTLSRTEKREVVSSLNLA